MCLFCIVTLAYGSSGTGSVGQNAGSTKALGTSVSEGRIEAPVGVELCCCLLPTLVSPNTSEIALIQEALLAVWLHQ